MIKRKRVACRAIIFKDGKILAQKIIQKNDGKNRNYICVPGGGLEDGESIIECVHREMIEETGITPKVGKLLFIQQYSDEDSDSIEFFFHIENSIDYEKIDLSQTTHGMLEAESFDFVDPSDIRLMPEFLRTINIQDYIDNQKPTYIAYYK